MPSGWTQIIVDGPDKSGKTTLVYNLSLEVGLPVHYPFNAYADPGDVPAAVIIEDLLEWREGKIMGIYEGHPLLHEYIYGPLHRGKVSDDFMDPGMRCIFSHMRLKCLILYCRPPDEMVEDPSLPFWDLLLRFPVNEFQIVEHDYTDPKSTDKIVGIVDRRIKYITRWEDSP